MHVTRCVSAEYPSAKQTLNDPEEDLYTAEDGAPFEEEPESNEEA